MRCALLLALLALAACNQPAPREAAPKGTSVTGNGFTLRSAAIALPADDLQFPDRPDVDLVTANCTACHSPAMLLTQPALKPEQWAATVKKMREVYKAPIADADVPGIERYLATLSAPPTAAAR